MLERAAIIDLGSNSARLIIMNIYRDGSYKLIYHQKEAVRLGEGLGEGKKAFMSAKAMRRAIDTLNVFAHMSKVVKADKILAVATAAVRGAKNGAEFIDMAKEKTGVPLRVIDGKEEARLGYLGVINTIDVKDALLFDLGGASTEITLLRDRQLAESVSLPIGAVTLTEKYACEDRLSEAALKDMCKYIADRMGKFLWMKDLSLPVVGIGGTVRSIAKIDRRIKDYPFPKIHNYRLGKLAMAEIWRNLIKTNLSQRQKISGLNKDRADIIVAGATIVKSILDISGGQNLIVSGSGVREGLFFSHFFKKRKEQEIISNILMHSTWNVLMFYQGDVQHHSHVCEMACIMFEAWQGVHKMGDRHKELLKVAAMLHDIGISINYYEHARHSAYLVENAALFGLTHREQILTAVIVGWHNGYAAKYMRNKLYSEFLDPVDWQIARRLALLLALAEAMDATQMQLIKSIESSFAGGKAYLKIIADQPVMMEVKAVSEYGKWFKKEMGMELIVK